MNTTVQNDDTQPNLKQIWDLAVIGAGPAGMAAATLAVERKLSVLVLDEQAASGGQIYRHITHSPFAHGVRQRAVLGDDYWHGNTLAAAFASSSAHLLSGATVWQIDSLAGNNPSYQLGISVQGKASLVNARTVLLASGAQERPCPIPGWTLPGVMTAGAAQALLKTTGAVPVSGTVLAGCGPLLWLLAAQVLRAGGRLEAILDTTPTGRLLRVAPLALDFVMSPYFRKGLQLMREVKRQVRVITGVNKLKAIGQHALEAVEYEAHGVKGRFAVDTLLLHQGVVPSINLSMAMRCEHHWNEALACWQPNVDMWQQASLPHIYIAGDAGGIGGARAAEEQGRLAALAIAHRLSAIDAAQRDHDAAPVRKRLTAALRGRRFFEALYRPTDDMRIPTGDTMVCRCEEVTANEVVQAARAGCSGPNQLKAYLRCGMGPCQGRLCGLTVTEILAHETGQSVAAMGYYRMRFPTKPLTLRELASMPVTEAAQKAVVTA